MKHTMYGVNTKSASRFEFFRKILALSEPALYKRATFRVVNEEYPFEIRIKNITQKQFDTAACLYQCLTDAQVLGVREKARGDW